MYGFKIMDSSYVTRKFTAKWQDSTVVSHDGEELRKAKVRNELAERLKEYVQQAEQDLAKGQWPPQELEDPNARAPHEIDSNARLPSEVAGQHAFASELPGQSRNTPELSGQGAVRRKPVNNGPRSYEMIAELPG